MSKRQRGPRPSPARTSRSPAGATAAAGRRGRAQLLLLVAAVAVLVALAHWPVLSVQAVSLDDNEFVVENPLVQRPGLASAGRFFAEVLTPSTVSGYYIPLTMTSLMLDAAAGGRAGHLQPFHRTALALHLLNTTLVIVLLYLLFGQPWPAALLGLLYGVHPLTVEVVAWVGERKTQLATLFSLLCLIGYVRFARTGRWWPYGGALAAYALALLSKPTSTPLPALLLLLDFWPLRRLGRRALVRSLPFFAVGAVSSAITVVSHARTASLGVEESATVGSTLLLVCHNLIFYVRKLLWPVDLTSAYPPVEPLSLANPAVSAGVAGVLLLTVLVAISLRWTRAALVAAAFFVIALLPTLGLVRYSWVLISDKYAYLPVVGVLIALAAALRHLWIPRPAMPRPGLWRGVCIGVVVALAAACAAGTRNYLAEWQTTERLYRHMLRYAPRAGLLRVNLGAELTRQGRFAEAEREFRQVLAMTPDSYRVNTNLGLVLAEQGRLDEALECYRRALPGNPEAHITHNNIGCILVDQGRLEEALPHLEEAIRLRPGYADPYNNLGRIRFAQEQLDAAQSCFEKAAQLNPSMVEAHANLGVVFARRGEFERAIAHYQSALRLQPDHPPALNNLGDALLRLGRLEEAAARLEQAVRRRPDYVQAWVNLGRARLAQGRADDALRAFETALRLAPDHPDARAGRQAAQQHRGGGGGSGSGGGP